MIPRVSGRHTVARAMTAPDTRPVILAYDASAAAQTALLEAVALFGNRPLIVASVWEPGMGAVTMPPMVGEPGMGYLPDPEEVAAIDRAESDHASNVAEAGARLARQLGATAEAVSIPDSADVARTLIEIADERDARAIVVGSRGLGGIKARVLGSTSRKLLHDAHRPVLVVRTH
jgi:nucleotide-binding universal stress UspA family protein